MLREVGKRDEPRLAGLLERHGPEMPRVMLRYADERLDAPVRARLLEQGGAVLMEGTDERADYSRLTGVASAAAFVGVASGWANEALNLAFLGAVILGFIWLMVVPTRPASQIGDPKPR
jgi:hypothetical protein